MRTGTCRSAALLCDKAEMMVTIIGCWRLGGSLQQPLSQRHKERGSFSGRDAKGLSCQPPPYDSILHMYWTSSGGG